MRKLISLFPILALISFKAFGAVDPQVEQAVQNYLHQLPADQLAKSNAYFEGGYWLLLWNLIYGLVIAFLLMKTPLSVKMRNLAEGIVHFRFLQRWIYAIEYLLITAVLAFPFTVYQGYFREHHYGLSNLTFTAWFWEQTKGLLIGFVLFGFLISLIYWAIQRFQKSWWVVGTLITTAFMIFAVMIAPVFLAPIFNTYQPLQEGPVKESILSMARSNGVPADNVYQFDASKQSKRISANVSGIFGTTRISLNDNLLQRTSPEEIRAVMGHEMGHYVLHHVFKLVMEFGLLFLIEFFLIFHCFQWFIKKYERPLSLRGVTDIAAFPVLLAIFSLLSFFATPITNTIVRTSEQEADIFGLNLAREPDGFARVALKLSEYRKMSPGPIEEFLFYDHPSGENRIRAAMTWKKENGGLKNEERK